MTQHQNKTELETRIELLMKINNIKSINELADKMAAYRFNADFMNFSIEFSPDRTDSLSYFSTCRSLLNKWRAAGSIPKANDVYMMSQILNCDMEYLMCLPDFDTPTSSHFEYVSKATGLSVNILEEYEKLFLEDPDAIALLDLFLHKINLSLFRNIALKYIIAKSMDELEESPLNFIYTSLDDDISVYTDAHKATVIASDTLKTYIEKTLYEMIYKLCESPLFRNTVHKEYYEITSSLDKFNPPYIDSLFKKWEEYWMNKSDSSKKE